MADNASSPTTTPEEIRSLLHDVESALSDTNGEASEKITELRERLRAVLAEGESSFERIRGEAIRRAKEADHLVRENPYYAVGVAAGVGALIGILLSRGGNRSA
jgi:ElaB protein